MHTHFILNFVLIFLFNLDSRSQLIDCSKRHRYVVELTRSMTTSLPQAARQSAATLQTCMTASGSSALTCNIGAPTTRATSVQYGDERQKRGSVVNPIYRTAFTIISVLGRRWRAFAHTNSYWRSKYGPILYHSDINRDIGRKSRFFILHLHFEAPLGVPSEYCHNIWYGQTRFMNLSDCEEVWEYVHSFRDNIHERVRQTDRHRTTA